jgi:hypothetical protein
MVSDKTLVEEMRRTLMEQVLHRVRDGISTKVTCDPPGASTTTTLLIRAYVFAPNAAMRPLEIRCHEVAQFKRLLTQQVDATGTNYFETRFGARELGPGEFRITLNFASESEAIGTCTVKIFSWSEILKAILANSRLLIRRWKNSPVKKAPPNIRRPGRPAEGS